MLQRHESPKACQKVIFTSPKIAGISQFHNHMTGRAMISATIMRITMDSRTPPKIPDEYFCAIASVSFGLSM